MTSPSVLRRARARRAASVLAVTGLASGLCVAVPAAASVSHAPAPRAATAAPSRTRLAQTPGQASAQAARTRRRVLVTGATTPSSTLTANPDGTYTVTESAAPVRVKIGGTWRNLNAVLVRDSHGSYSPAVSSQPLTISGGGTGPLAAMTYGRYSLTVSSPFRLPAPAVTGNTATYRRVLPGVDLLVTAQPSGGFSEVLRIASARAAANPALQTLTFTTTAKGLTLKPGRGGSITAVTPGRQVIFAAAAPRMWDSATKPIAANGRAAMNKTADQPAASTAASPGDRAHTAPLAVAITGSRITLVPDQQLLTGPGAVYPEYIDPTWDAAGSAASSWAYVSSDFPSQSYYGTSSTLQIGKNPDTGGTSYAYYQLPIPGQIYGAVIHSATVYFPEVWADSCTASPVQLWQTGAISSSTTYNSVTLNNNPAWISELGSDDVAYGWSSAGYIGGPSNCPANNNDVAYSITSTIASAAAGSWKALALGLKATDTSDYTGWKQFADPRSSPISANATLSISYAHTPATPVLSTSPAANCAAGTTVVGNGNVSLYAAVSDKDGASTGSLTVSYTALANGYTFATNASMSVSATSGTTAALQLKAADLQNADSQHGSNSQVTITWTATVSDGLPGVPSSPTASCTFIFSTAVPGRPDIIDQAGHECPTGLSATVGTPLSFTLEPNTTASAPAEPTAYVYQLNGGNPVTVAASAGPSYSAAISITPASLTNVLDVNAVAAGGNIGQTSSCVISAAAPGAAADQDLTGDGVPDLLTVGDGTTGTASGLWVADGQGNSSGRFDGTVNTTATDIAPRGPQDTGHTTPGGSPADWNGMKAITGQFTGPGFNDVEAYTPDSDVAYILPGQGDGSVITSQGINPTGLFDDTSQVSGTTNHPLQLVNAYNVSADATVYPDEIGVFDDSNPSVNGYLAYFAADAEPGSWDSTNGNYLGLPYELNNPSPDGSMDWNDWTIATDHDTRSGNTYTDMWMWNQSTGALYLWELAGLTNPTPGGFNPGSGTFTNPTATLTCSGPSGASPCGPGSGQTQIQIKSSGWNQNPLTAFQATDINGDYPGLVTVTSTGQVQSYAYDATSATLTQVNADNTSQELNTADPTWQLNDAASGTVTTATTPAADQPGAGAGDTEQDLTAVGNCAAWDSGDQQFSSYISLSCSNDTPNTSSYLTTSDPSSGAFAPGTSFTISAWVNPSVLGGTVFSQNGSEYSSVEVSTTTSGKWSVGMNTGHTTSGSYATATGGTALAGVWTNLTLTYSTGNAPGQLKLYANGTEIAYLLDSNPPITAGNFILGASQVNSSPASFLTGQLADVQVWHTVATPVQPATPGSQFVPVTPVRIMDTRSASGPIGPVTGPLAANSNIMLPIDGGNTSPSLPASGVAAVAVSVTVTGQTAAGFLTLYPADTPLPATSTVNFTSSGNATNNTIVPVGGNGEIAIYNNSSSSDQIIVDLTGYFDASPPANTPASTYIPLADPARILDTRNGTGAPQAPIAGDTALALTISGVAGIPSSGVTAVALNLTAVPPAAGDSGFLTLYPDGTTRPATSNLTYNAGDPQAGTVLIDISVSANGKIDIYNNSSTAVNLIGDVSGYFTNAPSAASEFYHPLDSTRIIDTRQTIALASNGSLTITNPPAILADNPALVLTITVTAPAAAGDITAYPSSAALPNASIVNFAAGETVANLALVNTATNNAFTIKNQSAGTVQVIVDTNGYFQ